MAFLPLLALVLAAHVWLWRSTFVPILQGDRVEYLLVAAPAWQLVLLAALAFVLLIAVHSIASRLLFHETTPGFGAADVAYFRPLALLAFSLIALANLAPIPPGWMFAWSYLAIDLRPWLTTLVVTLFAMELDVRARGEVRRLVTRARDSWFGDGLGLELALVVLAGVFVCVSSPIMRFDSSLHGDEPKYIRYCESWYQGGGFDLSTLKRVADLPADYSPHVLRNLRLIAETIPVEARELAADARRLMTGGFNQRFNRAKYLGGWFLEGKRGGVYQVHTPGISFLLFPAYFVDRYVLNWTYGDPRFPRELLASVTFTFVLYLLYGVVIFRFLRDYTGSAYGAWALAAIAMLILPLANFPFQFYPEVAAGIAIVSVTRYILFGDKTTSLRALWFGLLGGYLPWLHVRYLAVAALLLAGAIVVGRRRPRTAVTFAIGWSIAIGSMSFYAYHVTGSVLPTALYDVRGEVLSLRAVGPGLFGFLFDSAFGVIAQDPFLLLAFAGLPRLFVRRTGIAIFCGLLVALTAATASAHTFTAANTTPGRYLVGVLPFAMVAVWEAYETFQESRLFRICVAVLLVVSIQTAWVYNMHHEKAVGQIVDTSFSGWKLNLLFPAIGGFSWREKGFSSGFLVAWAFVYAALIVAPFVYWRNRQRRKASAHDHARPYAMALLDVLLVCGTVASASSLLAARPFDRTYLMPAKSAATESLRAARERGVWFAVSSTRGWLSRQTILDRSFESFALTVMPATPRASDEAAFIVWPSAGADLAGWGMFDLDFGDGERAAARPIFENTRISHTYASPGYYEATGHLAAGGRELTQRVPIVVSARASDRSVASVLPLDVRRVERLPAEVIAAPPTLSFGRAIVNRASVCVDAIEPGVPAGSRARLWVAHRSSQGWNARAYDLGADNCSVVDDGDRDGRPRFAAFMVTTEGSSIQRSELVVAYVPDRDALLETPIVVRAQAGATWWDR